MIKITQTLFILLIAIVISSCGESSPYPILDSGAGIDFRSGGDPIEWLDNYRVIYKGYSGPKPPPNKEGGWSPVDWGLFIWDTRTNETKRYADGGKVCYHDGYIYYPVKSREPATREFHVYAWMEGPFGKETYHQAKYRRGEKPPYEKLWRNPFSCRLSPVPEDTKGTIYMLLDEGDYIDRSGTHMGEESFVFHSKKKGIRKELPLPVRTTYKTIYVPFDGRYFMYTIFPGSSLEPCRIGQCQIAWWIDKEGNTEKVFLPFDKNKLDWDELLPVSKGYLLIQHAPLPLGGGYLVSLNGRIQTVLNGYIENPAVSPNGCKVAFTHYRNIEELRAGTRRRPTLKMIDFCSKD